MSDHDHHDHDHGSSAVGILREMIPGLHGHKHGEVYIDSALEGSDRGIWALKVSLAVLGVTALIQLVIVLMSGSVGLLADMIHNFSDALTAIPLGLAFVLGRRAATRRYTYGYGRAEDLAGVAIVATVAASAGLAGYEAIGRLLHPPDVAHLPYVAPAGVIGFFGNELL